MSHRTPDKFTLHVPDEQEPERTMPDRLELSGEPGVDLPLPDGAYDPYARVAGDTTIQRRLKTQDLRRLSEWIKAQRLAEQVARENDDAESGS